jgi:hypothetical protein
MYFEVILDIVKLEKPGFGMFYCLENHLREAEEAVKNPKLSKSEQSEAQGAKKAYAHCVGLIKAVLEKKGWV